MQAPCKIAVPIIHADAPLREQVADARAAGAELVELRVDMIGDAAAVEALLREPHEIPYILTIRSAAEGGRWDGDEAERISLIERLGLLRPGYVDVEWSTWRASANIRQKIGLVCDTDAGGESMHASRRARNKLILSHHDFEGTPADLSTLFADLAETPASVIKVATTARDATDALRMLEQLKQHAAARPTIAIAMGEAGLASRVLARKFGAFATFAAFSCQDGSAPGQPAVEQLRGLYRWDEIGQETRVYGVVGNPVGHSQSPAIHNAAMAADGVDGVYLPFPVNPAYEDFAVFADFASRNGWLDIGGLSVTLPHKQHALRWLEENAGVLEPAAGRIGAVNTLTAPPRSANAGKNGTGELAAGWRGANTDAPGGLAALQTVQALQGGGLKGRRVRILGAGGAARALAAGLREFGCSITIHNRTAARGAALADVFGCLVGDWDERCGLDGEIVINCTTVGLWPDVDDSPMPAERLDPGCIVFDTIYNPRRTRLLREAEARGCTVVSGVEMFIAQAAAQYGLWHRRDAPHAIMRRMLA